jgi:Sulfotransferase domain
LRFAKIKQEETEMSKKDSQKNNSSYATKIISKEKCLMKQKIENKEIYIHIGYPKTGTTTLQNHLFKNHAGIKYFEREENTLSRGIKYFEREKKILSFISSLFFSRENSFKKNVEDYRQELLKFTDTKDVNKFVFSEELLTAYSMVFKVNPRPYVWTLEPNSIARKLKIAFVDTNVFDKIKIIITIRKQDDMLKSFYGQSYNCVFKNFSLTKTFKKFLHYAIEKNPDNFIIDALHYNEIVSEYESLFGRDNICILVFEQLKQDQKSYIKKLCRFMDINECEAICLLEGKHLNKRNSSTGYRSDEINLMEVIAYYKNKYLCSKSFGLSKSWIVKFLRKIHIPGKVLKDLKIGSQYDRKLKMLYSKANRKLSERYDLKLKKYGYYYE